MIPRALVVAVCTRLVETFPDGDADPPWVPDDYYDGTHGVVRIRNQQHSLRISEECFEHAGVDEIVEALQQLDYDLELETEKQLLLGSVPPRERPQQYLLSSLDKWYLARWLAD